MARTIMASTTKNTNEAHMAHWGFFVAPAPHDLLCTSAHQLGKHLLCVWSEQQRLFGIARSLHGTAGLPAEVLSSRNADNLARNAGCSATLAKPSQADGQSM